MSKRPSADDFHVAAEWLGIYESVGTDDTTEQACKRVAAWLLVQADASGFWQACCEAGIRVDFARKAMAQVDVKAMQLDHHQVTWASTNERG